MTDTPQAPAIPALGQMILRAIAQKALASAATLLTGYGVISAGQSQSFVALGLSVILWAASFFWTYAHEHGAHNNLVAALNAPSPIIPAPPASEIPPPPPPPV